MPTQTDKFSEFMQSIAPGYKSPVKKELTKEELEQLNNALPKKPKTYLESVQRSENPYSSEYYKKVADEKRAKEDSRSTYQILKDTFNPYNFGVPDYSNSKSFSDAYRTAIKNKGKEFMWNNKRFNTHGKNEVGKPIQYREDKTTNLLSGLIPDKQQRGTGKNTIYFEELSHYYKGKDYDYSFITKGKYKPSISKGKNIDYIAINSDNFKNRILEEWNDEKNPFIDNDNNQKHLKYKKDLDALGNFNIHNDSDERGEYISYYDLWDVNTLSDNIGKPFEIYDRIYIKDYGDGQKKRMHYSDKELSKLNPDEKDFDTLALQLELDNRGFKLPNSKKNDGSYDGILGNETKSALIE